MLHSVSQTNKLLFDYVYKGDAMKNNILMLTRVLTLVIAALLVGSVWGFTTNQDSDINANLTVTGALEIGSVDKDGGGVVVSVAENADSDNTIPTTKAVKEYVDSVNPVYGLLVKSNFVALRDSDDNVGILTLNLNPGNADLLLSEKVTISSDDEVQVTGLNPSEEYRVTVAIDYGQDNSTPPVNHWGFQTYAMKTNDCNSTGGTDANRIATSRTYKATTYQSVPTDILTFDTEETKFTLCLYRPSFANEDIDFDNSSSLLVAIYKKPTT